MAEATTPGATAVGRAARASAFAGLFLPKAGGVAEAREAPAMARLSLRAGTAARETLAAALGMALPERINTSASTGARAALRLGPDEWLILAEPGAAAPLMDAAGRIDRAVPHALVDVGERSTGIVLGGPAVEDVLAAGCPLPLDLAAFPVGRATRTLLAKAEIVLWRRGADSFHLEAGRSFVPYVVALLAEAIRHEAAIRAAAVRLS